MKKISIEELLIWFKYYERYMEGDPIDAVDWRGEFLEFVMYLVNNLEDKEELEDPIGDGIRRDILENGFNLHYTKKQEGVCKYCGGSNITIGGEGTTHYYYCEDCKRPTDKVEKQEEWKELRSLLEGWISNPNIVDEVVNRISQLLSERTFTKEELEIMLWLVRDRDNSVRAIYRGGKLAERDKEVSRKLLYKLAKLLKEQE